MEEAISQLIKGINDQTYPFLFVNGTFGVGKTFILHEAINQIVNTNKNFISIEFDFSNIHHLHQIPNSIKIKSNLKGTNSIFDELIFFTKRYLNNIDFLNTSKPNLAKFFFDLYRLRDYFETNYLNDTPFFELQKYEAIVEQLFEKKIERRTLLKLFDVLSEAIIISLLQMLEQNEISEKLQVLISIDNYDHCAGTIDQWAVNHLYKAFFYKNFENFESYKIDEAYKTAKAVDFFDVKFVFISRNKFTLKKILNFEPEEKVKQINIQPLSIEEIPRFLEEYKCDKSPQEIFSLTYGIPFASDYLCKNLYCDINQNSEKEYFKTIYEKIVQQINPKILETIKFLSVCDFFTPETIRCLPENYPFYEKLYKYLVDSTEIATKTTNDNDLFQINYHYKFFLTKYLQIFEPEKYQHYQSLFNSFKTGFEILKHYNYEQRKIIRNLAYLKEFDLGEILQTIFQEDYPKVEKFVRENSNFFKKVENVFEIPNETRKKILEFNKIVDNERYDLKEKFIKETLLNKQKELALKLETLSRQKEENAQRIKKIQYIKSRLNDEIQEIQKQIVSTENYLIDLHTKRYKTSRKYTWLPFILLAVSSIVAFVIGNNILYIFSETMNEESISGLGTAFKILSILLFGILLYILIDHFGSKERKEFIRRAEEFIVIQENNLNELKECLNEYKQTLKQFEEELNSKLKENQSIDYEINRFEKISRIAYINTT